jgi:hypothetical protein
MKISIQVVHQRNLVSNEHQKLRTRKRRFKRNSVSTPRNWLCKTAASSRLDGGWRLWQEIHTSGHHQLHNPLALAERPEGGDPNLLEGQGDAQDIQTFPKICNAHAEVWFAGFATNFVSLRSLFFYLISFPGVRFASKRKETEVNSLFSASFRFQFSLLQLYDVH